MSNAEEHAAAIAALNESDLGGRTIYVSESLPKDKVAENKKRDPKKKSKFILALEELCRVASYLYLLDVIT